MDGYTHKNGLLKKENYFNGAWCVYIHIFPKSITGHDYDKYYVGITSQGVSRRWRPDGSGYNNQKYMRNAIKKYGWDNIQHEVIADNLTFEEANGLEQTLIKQLDCFGKYGYNRSDGNDEIGVKVDLSGGKFGRLTVLKRDSDKEGHYWICQCGCGNICSVSKDVLMYNENCACEKCTKEHRNKLIMEQAKYRDKNTQIYELWRKIRRRSTHPNENDNDRFYIDPNWVNDFLFFQNWCLENGFVNGWHLVLKDKSLGYNPDNCIWLDPQKKTEYKTQYRAKKYEYDGLTMTTREWAEYLKIPYKTFKKRLSKMPLDKAITTPYHPRKGGGLNE